MYKVKINIIIKTRFEKLTNVIDFQPQTINKGKDLVKSNHVYDVQEIRANGQNIVIKAFVIRQASVSSPPYKVTLEVIIKFH